MNISVDDPHTLGQLIRAYRKALGLRQDDAAGGMGVSENFLSKVERGSGTVQWGKLLHVLDQLGLQVTVSVPQAYATATQAHLGKAQRPER